MPFHLASPRRSPKVEWSVRAWRRNRDDVPWARGEPLSSLQPMSTPTSMRTSGGSSGLRGLCARRRPPGDESGTSPCGPPAWSSPLAETLRCSLLESQFRRKRVWDPHHPSTSVLSSPPVSGTPLTDSDPFALEVGRSRRAPSRLASPEILSQASALRNPKSP